MRVSRWIGVPALLLCLRGISAQIVEVSAGASTAYDAQGATLHLRNGSMDTQLGFGVVGGHLAAGGAIVHTTKAGTVTLGQQELGANLPTDVFDTRHTLLGTGIGLKRTTNLGTLTTFTGFTSLEAGTPLFRASNLGKVSHFTQWTLPTSARCKPTLTALTGTVTIGIASVECVQSRIFTYALSAGAGAGSPYLAASIVLHTPRLALKSSYVYASAKFQRGNNPYQPTPEPIRENIAASYRLSPSLSISATHGNYVTAASKDAAIAFFAGNQKSSLNTAGVQFDRRNFAMNATVLRSSFTAAPGQASLFGNGQTTALSASLRYTAGRVEWSETFLHANTANAARTTILSSAASLSLNSRIRLSEGINVTAQGITFSHGGTFLTRFSSFQADYQFFYVANRPDQPFQQALLLNAELQLPGRMSLLAMSTINAVGAPLYTFQLGRSFSRDSGSRGNLRVAIGQSTLTGRVEDTSGAGVGRAALMIGTERVYTDDTGNFLFREKHARTHPLRVLTEEFVSADNFTVVDAPAEVRTGDANGSHIRVVVSKQRSQNTGPA